MKLATISVDEKAVVVALADRGWVDTGFESMNALIEAGDAGLSAARSAIAGSASPLVADRFLAPLRPRRIIGTAINYATHKIENPDWVDPGDPMVSWWKGPHAIVGPGDPIVLPDDSVIKRDNWFNTTYEVEVLVVMGKSAKQVSAADADEYIFGYTLINDVTAAGLMLVHAQMMLGKNIDTFAPIGPIIVTKDEFDLETAHISCIVNGVTVQDEPVANMLHKPPRLIEWVSSIITIDAGDCISTGTPRGTALWHPDHPWLKPGDVVTVKEATIGELTNPVVAPTPPSR